MAEFDRIFGCNLGKPRCRDVAGLTTSPFHTSKSPARRARTNALLASPQRGGVRCAPVPSRRTTREASQARLRGPASARPLAEPVEARVRSSNAARIPGRGRSLTGGFGQPTNGVHVAERALQGIRERGISPTRRQRLARVARAAKSGRIGSPSTAPCGVRCGIYEWGWA